MKLNKPRRQRLGKNRMTLAVGKICKFLYSDLLHSLKRKPLAALGFRQGDDNDECPFVAQPLTPFPPPEKKERAGETDRQREKKKKTDIACSCLEGVVVV